MYTRIYIYIYMYLYIYIHTHTYIFVLEPPCPALTWMSCSHVGPHEMSVIIYTYVYIHTYVCMCVYIYIYMIFIVNERRNALLSPLSKKTCVIHVMLDKWFPLAYTAVSDHVTTCNKRSGALEIWLLWLSLVWCLLNISITTITVTIITITVTILLCCYYYDYYYYHHYHYYQ